MVFEKVDPEKGFSWNQVKPKYVSPVKFNAIINELKNDKDLAHYRWESMHIKYRRIANSWSLNDQISRKEIRVNRELEVKTDENNNIICVVQADKYIWLENKVIPSDDDMIEDEETGLSAFLTIQSKFNKFNKFKGGCSLEKLFSGKEYKEQYFYIKECVPVQIQFMNPGYEGKIVEGVYKADVSSAFPTQIMRDLPTLHDCKTVSGKVEPSEEYPFAFYTKSHHIKTLDGYDSHELKSWYYRDEYYKCDDKVKDADETTILCKKMSDEYHTALAKAFQDCYDHRKDDDFNKFVMNASIGYFQRNMRPVLSFISAIVILRCNIDMLRRCKQLEKEGNTILFIATDSIAWKGKLSPVAVDEKYLGSFTYEGKNIRFLGYSCKIYQWEDNEGKCITKYSGVKKEVSSQFKFGDLLHENIQERRRYQWDAKNMQFYESALI